MKNHDSQLYFLFSLIVAASVLSFFVLQPFLYTIILAVVFAVVFKGLYAKTLRFLNDRKNVAAALTTLAVVVFILVPLAFLSVRIVEEAVQVYAFVANGGGSGQIASSIEIFLGKVQSIFLSAFNFSPDRDVSYYIQQFLSWLVQNLIVIFSSVVSSMVHVFVFLVTLFYLLRDGQALTKKLVALSPLPDTHDETVLAKLEAAVHSAVTGSLATAAVQGIFSGVGFAIFGIPQVALWGVTAAVAALIPVVGTSLVIGPAVIFLFLSGHIPAAIGLLIWGIAAVGLIDNILGPKLIGRGIRIHPLLVFISVLGGIGFFGPIGFVLGPLTLSLLFALFDIYAFLVQGEK